MVNSFIEKIQHVIYISSAGRKTHLLDDSISEENHRFESMGKHSETPKSKPLFPSKYQRKKKKKKKDQNQNPCFGPRWGSLSPSYLPKCAVLFSFVLYSIYYTEVFILLLKLKPLFFFYFIFIFYNLLASLLPTQTYFILFFSFFFLRLIGSTVMGERRLEGV